MEKIRRQKPKKCTNLKPLQEKRNMLILVRNIIQRIKQNKGVGFGKFNAIFNSLPEAQNKFSTKLYKYFKLIEV